ncbi:MAG: hypothetical protein RR998_04645 [Oscillospiraceae bacterium]
MSAIRDVVYVDTYVMACINPIFAKNQVMSGKKLDKFAACFGIAREKFECS